MVDLCTGSGAIARERRRRGARRARPRRRARPGRASRWAERNLAGTGVDLRLGDMAEAFADLDGTVDVVVCNPPYIPLEALASVAPEARDHDPALALWSGRGRPRRHARARAHRRAAAEAGRLGRRRARRRAGRVGAGACSLAAGRWSEVRDHQDLAGRARYVMARLAR